MGGSPWGRMKRPRSPSPGREKCVTTWGAIASTPVMTRAVLSSTGQNIDALSVFGHQMRFDLGAGFPAVTTKRLAFGNVVHELIWILRGSTNIGYLRANKVTIWDEWADAEGELGPVYGKQWRSWAAPNGETIDQIANLVQGIEAVK